MTAMVTATGNKPAVKTRDELITGRGYPNHTVQYSFGCVRQVLDVQYSTVQDLILLIIEL